MKGPGRNKKKGHVTIKVVGHLLDIMLRKVVSPKFEDIGSPIVTVNIKCVFIIDILKYLGEEINVMIKYTMLNLNMQALLRHTTIVLQLAYNSTICPEGIIEDVTICVDSWEYPIDFIVLRINK